MPPLWKAAPGRQFFTEPGITGVVLVLTVNVHPNGICLEQQVHLSPAKAECASLSRCACVPEKGHQSHHAPSPACVSCRMSSLYHMWKDHQRRACSEQQLVRKPLGAEGGPGHRWMSGPAQQPPSLLLAVTSKGTYLCLACESSLWSCQDRCIWPSQGPRLKPQQSRMWWFRLREFWPFSFLPPAPFLSFCPISGVPAGSSVLLTDSCQFSRHVPRKLLFHQGQWVAVRAGSWRQAASSGDKFPEAWNMA